MVGETFDIWGLEGVKSQLVVTKWGYDSHLFRVSFKEFFDFVEDFGHLVPIQPMDEVKMVVLLLGGDSQVKVSDSTLEL